EDVLHDAIVRAATRCESFRGESKFTTWLFAIIVNVWRDRLGQRTAALELEVEPPDVRSLEPIGEIQSAEMAEVVAAKISQLPPRQREVLILVAFEQLGASEAAAVLGISEQNVRVNLFHARARLKQELALYLTEESSDRRRSAAR